MPTFSFDKVNHIIEVAAPTTEVTIQELINAIRDYEDELENMEVAKIADASGKEDLGGGLQVGISLKLLNWKFQFEDRPGPDWVDCSVTGGNLLAVDANNQPMNPIEPAAYVTITVERAVSAVLLQEPEILEIKAKTDNLPSDPAGMVALAAAHGSGSWEGATPTQVWNHTDRRLTSRDIDSPTPGESLPSEEQVQAAQAALDAIKGLGFETTEDALRVIRQLVQAAGRRGASFKV
jgi:hypothetical protein